MNEAPPQGTVRDWLAMRAHESADEVSHIFTDGTAPLTWGALQRQATSVAQHLATLGQRKGESVAIMLPNSAQAVVSLFGCLIGGYRATMINLAAGAEAIGYALSHSEARVAILNRDSAELFGAATALHPNTITCLTPEEAVANAQGTFEGTLDALEAGDDALLMYTSGTTGRPKGVVHSHASLLAGGWTTTLAHSLTPADRALCVLPIYHINGLCVTIIAPLVSGGSVVVCPKFSARRFWTDCAEHDVTWFSVVPTIISHLLHAEDGPDAAVRARLRFGRSASAALAPEVQSAFESRFDVPIVETMGLTETAAQILSNPLPPGQRKIGSPGRPYGNEATVLDRAYRPLPAGEEGEIAVRGPNVMVKYLRNPEATAKTFTPDGWLLTGDLGRRDEDGYFFVTGRIKELIIKGGENIAPREIDEALYSHTDVIEAAAFSRACPSYGERVEAAVTIKPGSTVSSEDLIAVCREKLGAFKSPDRVYILAEMPKGPSGKIQRLKLAAATLDIVSL